MCYFNYREATITYDFERRLVEFYFTKEGNYETCKKRNPNFAVAEDLKPGYRLLYPFNQCRTPEYLLRSPQKVANTGSFETGKVPQG